MLCVCVHERNWQFRDSLLWLHVFGVRVWCYLCMPGHSRADGWHLVTNTTLDWVVFRVLSGSLCERSLKDGLSELLRMFQGGQSHRKESRPKAVV